MENKTGIRKALDAKKMMDEVKELQKVMMKARVYNAYKR